MKPRRPYLLRALHEWIIDSGATPHILVDAKVDGVIVPRQHVKDDRIVLNVSFNATQMLKIGNETVSFFARFDGSSFEVQVPIKAVVGIYARETRQGQMFQDDDFEPDPGDKTPPPAGKRPKLQVVK